MAEQRQQDQEAENTHLGCQVRSRKNKLEIARLFTLKVHSQWHSSFSKAMPSTLPNSSTNGGPRIQMPGPIGEHFLFKLHLGTCSMCLESDLPQGYLWSVGTSWTLAPHNWIEYHPLISLRFLYKRVLCCIKVWKQSMMQEDDNI